MKEVSPLMKRLGNKLPVNKTKEVSKEDVPQNNEEIAQTVENPKSELLAPVAKKLNGIDLKKLKAQALKEEIAPEALCLLVLGKRQGGKSTLLGTASGTMILFTTSDEAHSIETARSMAAVSYGLNIIPVILDLNTEDDKGNPLPPSHWSALSSDQAYAKLISYLDALESTEDIASEIQWIALESMYSIMKKIDEKKNIQNLKNVSKNNFRAQEVALKELLDINQKLLLLQKRGVNIVFTCPVAAEQDKTTGLYDQVEPLVQGYRNNLHVVGIFPDICLVGKATIEAEDGEATSGYFLQFMGTATKSGKKVSGEDRCINFSPRINGLLDHETPDILNADLTELAEYKANVRKQRKLKGE